VRPNGYIMHGMSKTLFILGRQPELGAAELESLFGPDKLEVISGGIGLLDIEHSEINFERIGGSLKMCEVLTTLPFTDWRQITDYLVENVPRHTDGYESGKLTFGISTYGLKASPKHINATALSVKKAIRQSGRPVRVVPNKTNELNSAQVLHNKLTDLPLGMELILANRGDSVILAQTVVVQDIEAYAARDQQRPKRDARVGMLPPKLAQILINLATPDLKPAAKNTILDPFCGSGVVLQESLLMGFSAYGTDLDERMVEYANFNINWLKSSIRNFRGDYEINIGDATNFQWTQEIQAVATETYLGRPFSSPPSNEVLSKVMSDVDLIHKKFLSNLANQTKPGLKICLAVPAWNIKNRFKHLKILDSLEKLGYTRLKFDHASREKMIYHRPGQIVGRELVVLKRI